ncbi:unnamed protein product [Penicillium salamii]|uniref:Hemopexin/matrixin n=1 Tax=Penicillium salamii TaxID=1612424 RepID=A0A9W4NP24_9EURO|nr:unnamed protein product [Penicillium salamii]CAG8051690.1 unnamed protein product [Penicillium salamii]CAG8165635.1 unnamed protein product [Penicillium salamii]CAG8206308.1 unnamed protein product [Penicillium salamii]CAG8233103.1 unnamed protein product [Penicillium salamii]
MNANVYRNNPRTSTTSVLTECVCRNYIKVPFGKSPQWSTLHTSTETSRNNLGPAKIADHWQGLVQAKFNSVDALLEVPGEADRVWAFRGLEFVRIQVLPGGKGKSTFGPAKIANHWPSLVKAGFATVDAILPVPGQPYEAYVFNQDRYAKISLTPGSPNSGLLSAPAKITDDWPSLAKAGFGTIDTAVVAKGIPEHAWVFYDDQYVRIKITPGDSELVFGPASVQKHWPNLDWV